MKKYGAIISSTVCPANIIIWECCQVLGRMWNSFSSHLSISGLHTEMYLIFVNTTLWLDTIVREVRIKDVHAHCHTSMTWLLFTATHPWHDYFFVHICEPIIMIFFCHLLHGGSWNLDFLPSFLCKFSVGLKNSFFEASSDILIFLWSFEPVKNVYFPKFL
jgi:hypothetical protein